MRGNCKSDAWNAVRKFENNMNELSEKLGTLSPLGSLIPQLSAILKDQTKIGRDTGGLTVNVTTNNVDNSRQTQNIDNSYKVLSHIQGDVGFTSQQITNIMPAPVPLPGWPTKWPPPLVDPKPFASPSGVEVDELRQAAARLGPAETDACRKGEPRAVSALLMEVLRRIHSSPEQRNIYLSPDRGDQALVFVLRQWLLKPLQEATHHIFEQVVKELMDLPMQGNPVEENLMVGAKDGFEKKPQAVVQTSNIAMTAHLKNMEALLRVPGQQVLTSEDTTWTAGDEPPQLFCHEAFGHIKLESTLYTMEHDAGINSSEDVVEARCAEQARQAIYSLARQVLRWKAKNQTAVQTTERMALIYTYRGWEEHPATEVSEKLFRRFAKVVASFVDGPVATPLKPLGEYITRHIDKLAANERSNPALLRQYSLQADRICATSTNPEFVKLKELLRAAKEQPAPFPALQSNRASLAEQTTGVSETIQAEPRTAEEEDGVLRIPDILDLLGWN